MKNNRLKINLGLLLGNLALLICLISTPMTVSADDFSEYAQAGAEIDLPPAGGFYGNYSWFTAAEYFPTGTSEVIDGFEAEGRILAATGKEIYMQRNYGSGGTAWEVVATVEGGDMDPSFIRISPDGSTIALGTGYGAPLMVFPTEILSVDDPPVLDTHESVTSFSVNYYDAAWVDNQYLVINGGSWPGPDFSSGVGVLNTSDASDTGTGLIGNIPGASAGVAVDKLNGRIVTGIGYATGPPNRTGEIKVWDAGEWSTTPATTLDYETNTKIVADNVLSAAYLSFDTEGNLTVGGGDAFGTGGTTENGYAALINSSVIARVTTGGDPVDDGDWSDTSEYRMFAPDPCMNDSATGIVYGDWGEALSVVWNPLTTTGACDGSPGSAVEYWSTGVVPTITTYYPGDAPDLDDDGIPDAADNAYLTANAGQEDTDEDGWANIADADFDNNNIVNTRDLSILRQSYGESEGNENYNPDADMNSDGIVNSKDRALFRKRLGTEAPYY